MQHLGNPVENSLKNHEQYKSFLLSLNQQKICINNFVKQFPITFFPHILDVYLVSARIDLEIFNVTGI